MDIVKLQKGENCIDVISPFRRASALLKEFSEMLKPDCFNNCWTENRITFCPIVDGSWRITDLNMLFHALQILERSLADYFKTSSWSQWKKKYWMMIMTPEINRVTVTTVMISLRFLHQNLIPEAFQIINAEWEVQCEALINPLEKIHLYLNMHKDFGYYVQKLGYSSLETYEDSVEAAIVLLEMAACQLDRLTQGTGIAGCTAGGISIVAGGVGLIGAALAPITAGVSLILTIIGASVGGVGGAVSISSIVAKAILEKKKVEEMKELTDSAIGNTLVLNEILKNSITALIELIGLMRAAASRGYSSYDETLLEDIINHFLSGDQQRGANTSIIFSKSLSTSIGISGIATNTFVRALSEIDSLGMAISSISGVLAALAIGFGIWEVVINTQKIKSGSVVAKRAREVVEDLKKGSQFIKDNYKLDLDRFSGITE